MCLLAKKNLKLPLNIFTNYTWVCSSIGIQTLLMVNSALMNQSWNVMGLEDNSSFLSIMLHESVSMSLEKDLCRED